MKRQKVFNVLLRLLALFGVEARTDLDSRDIAVSDQIVAAKEVTVVLYSKSFHINFHPHVHSKVRVMNKSWLHVALIMSNYELTTRWGHN